MFRRTPVGLPMRDGTNAVNRRRQLAFESLEQRHLLAGIPASSFDFEVGATGLDQGRAVGTDSQGNVYVVGAFEGKVFFDSGQSVELESSGIEDAFVAKYTSSGDLSWARRFGGSGEDIALDVAVDNSDNIYVTGYFTGNATTDSGQGLSGGAQTNAFVAKLDPEGEFNWIARLGTDSRTEGYGIGVDGNGHVYVGGYFRGTADFDPGPNAAQRMSAGNGDQFVVKLGNDGSYIWASTTGGTGNDGAGSLVVDQVGNVYTTGSFQGTADFDPGSGTFHLSSAGDDEIFVNKLDVDGNFVWARRLGGSGRDHGNGIAVDDQGSVYTTGLFTGTADFDPAPDSAFPLASAGKFDAFVSKLDGNGDFSWAKRWGSPGTSDANASDGGLGIALGPGGQVYTTGYFAGTVDFDPGPEEVRVTTAGHRDVFVSTLDTDGHFVDAKTFGGMYQDVGLGIAVDKQGNVFATGYTDDSAGNRDVFLIGTGARAREEIRVNTFTPGLQRHFPSSPETVAVDADGNFVIVWASDGQDGSGFGVYGQRFDAVGRKIGAEFRVNTVTSGDQYEPTVEMAPSGEFIVAWTSEDQDGSGNGVFAQRYDAQGIPESGEFRVTSSVSGNQQAPTIAIDQHGNFVIAWDTYSSTTSGEVFARLFDSHGNPQAHEFQVNSTTHEEQWQSSVAMDANGNFVVTWHSRYQDGNDFGIYAQRYDRNANPQGGEFRVNSSTTGHQSNPATAIDPEGNFVITWIDRGRDGDDFGIVAQRYNANGDAVGQEFVVNSHTAGVQRYTAVAMDADGAFVITWHSVGQDGDGSTGVYAQRFDPGGQAVGPEFRVGATVAGLQQDPSVDMTPDGRLVITWDGNGHGDDHGVFAQTRRVLAANLQISDALLVDQFNNPISAPYHGEEVYVRAEWLTTDLAFSDQYRVRFAIDGTSIDSATINGSGGTNVAHSWHLGGWYASPGQHTVQVTVDGDDNVSELTEADNTVTFAFTVASPTTLPNKFIWPVEGEPFTKNNITNYVDVDPSSGILDYNGGSASYDGHRAWDIGPGLFREMDLGVELYAAAAGTVTAVHDGEYDRQTDGFAISPRPPANYVIINHGSGWETIYWHLRRDSLQVEVGQTVNAGDFLGYMGSSGVSTAIHLHFGVRHNGRTVEPAFDAAAYFKDPIRYVGDAPTVYQSGVTNYVPSAHGQERPSDVEIFNQSSGQTAYAWARFSGLRNGDLLQYLWTKPDDSVYATSSHTIPQDYASSWWWFSRTLPTMPDLGTWKVQFLVNGAKLSEDTFEVTGAGAPEIRMEHGGELILDDRYTPIDFDTAAQNAASPTTTFTVINHGSDTLTLSDLRVPAGFSITEGLSASLSEGQSDTFTIAMNTATAGYFAGEVRFTTNDADESEYNFSIEGIVDAAASETLVLGISERSANEGNSLVANVRRSGSTAQAVTVTLSSSDVTEVRAPITVTIPAGQERVSFVLNAVDDSQLDPDRITYVFATATGYAMAQNSLLVRDVTLDDETAVVVTQSGTLNKGATLLLTAAQLSASDADSDEATLLFTVQSLPGQGTLNKDGTALAAGGTFTQADITTGKISYSHNDSETTSDSFTFTVQDGAGNETAVTTFNVTVVESSIRGAFDDGRDNPLVEAMIELVRNGGVVDSVIADAAGQYRFPNKLTGLLPGEYTIRATLRNNDPATDDGILRVLYGDTALETSAETPPFTVDVGEQIITNTVAFGNAALTPVGAIPGGRLDDLAAIYVHSMQALVYGRDVLGVSHDLSLPIDVHAYRTPAGVFYKGGDIFIDASSSDVTDADRPMNREWHEMFHQLMDDAVGIPPRPAGDSNHGGFSNFSTSDSWVEGWAEFWPTQLAEVLGNPDPHLYRWAGGPTSLEVNYLAHEPTTADREEFAVASLLLDLVDEVSTADDDAVDIDPLTLWALGTGTALADMKDVYDALRANSIGSADTNDDGTTDLDEVFIAHGFFVDTNGNAVFDQGEEIGRAADQEETTRRNTPPIPGSAIRIIVTGEDGLPVEEGSIEVVVRFAGDASYYDYSYSVDLASVRDGLLGIDPPPPRYDAELSVRVVTPAGTQSDEFAFSNTAFWELYTDDPGEFVASHEFDVGKPDDTTRLNRAPEFASVNNVSVFLGKPVSLVVQANDSDVPKNKLSYSLDPASPAGASLDPQSGEFHWTPGYDTPLGVVDITVAVLDDGTPPLSDQQTFQVFVMRPSFSNPRNRFDVDDSGSAGIRDVVAVATYLHSPGIGDIPLNYQPGAYIDVDDNGRAQVFDLALVVGEVHRIFGGGEGEPNRRISVWFDVEDDEEDFWYLGRTVDALAAEGLDRVIDEIVRPWT